MLSWFALRFWEDSELCLCVCLSLHAAGESVCCIFLTRRSSVLLPRVRMLVIMEVISLPRQHFSK